MQRSILVLSILLSLSTFCMLPAKTTQGKLPVFSELIHRPWILKLILGNLQEGQKEKLLLSHLLVTVCSTSAIAFTHWSKFKGAMSHNFRIFLKGCKVSSHQLNSKNNGLPLLLKTILQYWNCVLLSVATDGKDGNGVRLEEIAFDAMFSKITPKKLLLLVVPDKI